MKTKVILLFSLITLIIIPFGCDKNDNSDKDYIVLESFNFFKLPDNVIVDSIASILDINAFAYEGIVDRWEENHGVAGCNWIKEGKKYVNTDGQSIIIWEDSLANLNTITYLHYRKSKSDSWSNDITKLEKYLDNIFSGLGLIQKSNENYLINKSAGGTQNIKWYDVLCNHTFNTDTIAHPVFQAELEGDTCKINYLMIQVWYTNLDDINTYLSDIAMEENAKNFFVENYEGTSDAVENIGYWIIYKKLCKAFETRIAGESGSYRVYIDIQTGEIVHYAVI